MAKIDLEALKREAMSISATETDARQKQPNESRSLLIKRRNEANRIIGETLTKAGIDVAALREKLLKNDRTFRDAARGLQKPKPETLAKRRIAFENNIAQRRALLEPFGSVPTSVQTRMVYLSEPFFVTVSPNSSYGFLQSTSIAPYDSRAKLFVPSTDNGATANCDFWFTWFNDSAFVVTVKSASSQTVLNGLVDGQVSKPAWELLLPLGLEYHQFNFYSGTNFYIYQQQTESAYDGVGGQSIDLVARWEDKGQLLSIDYQTLNVSTFSYTTVIVPPQAGILIRVSPYIIWDFHWGIGTGVGLPIIGGTDEGDSRNSFEADFASERENYFVQCSGVALEIQTPLESYPGA